MDWDQELTGALDVALNESGVAGIDIDTEQGLAKVRLDVLALPEEGPAESDTRRVLILTGVSSAGFSLRREGAGLGPMLPLGSLAAAQALFGRMRWAFDMYGWGFVDITGVSGRWDDEPALTVPVRPGRAAHSLYWFTECGLTDADAGADTTDTIGTDGEAHHYLFYGTIWFDGLQVERADGTPVPVAEFTAAAARWWDAFNAHDPRLSVRAQREAGARRLSWRPDGGSSTLVPGGA